MIGNEIQASPADIASSVSGTDTDGWIRALQAETAEQTRCAKKQLNALRLCAAALVGMLVILLAVVLTMAPKAYSILERTQTAVQRLDAVTASLEKADLPGTIRHADALIGQTGADLSRALAEVKRAVSVIADIDVVTLNRAISDLWQAVAPLAKLFGGKG